MSRRLPPLNPLRMFEAAARHGSVSNAANELNVTHSAVSHQIKTLESSLDVKLFKRDGRRLVLSEQGALLLPAVWGAFEDIAQAAEQIKRPTTRGDLAVSCPPALLSLWLLPRINEFTELFPSVRLTLTSSYNPDNIHSPDYDVCLLYGDGNWPDCWVRHWAFLELFPVMSPTLLNRKPLRFVRDLRHHVMLHNHDHSEWRTWLDAVGGASDANAKGTHHFFSDARLSTDAAVHGQGIAMGDTMTASNLLSQGALVLPFDRSVPAKNSFYVACRNDVRSVSIVKVFIDWLFAACDASTRARPATRSLRYKAHRHAKMDTKVEKRSRHRADSVTGLENDV